MERLLGSILADVVASDMPVEEKKGKVNYFKKYLSELILPNKFMSEIEQFNADKSPLTEEQEKPIDLERWLSLELPRQYREKAQILNNAGLLEMFRDIISERIDIYKGLRGIDGKRYRFPIQEEIANAIREKREIYERKMQQGFTEMEIVPFGLPLSWYIKMAEKVLRRHHKEKKLFATRKDPEDESEKLETLPLDTNQPIWVADEDKNADKDGSLIYFPEKFDRDPLKRRGKTKRQILEETGRGFHVILREKSINIPREGKGITLGLGDNRRKQFEAGRSPEEYLKAIQTEDQYIGEEGQTPEDWLTLFIVHLEKYNQVIDDFKGNGSLAYNIGAYFAVAGSVPRADWSRYSGQVHLDWIAPRHCLGYCGVRGRVRIL